MARVILVTGGARSGKSAYAQKLAEDLPGPRVYVASCPVLDDEMRARIERHKAERAHGGWQTIEEQLDLAGVIRSTRAQVLLIDCLTLWINNLMFVAQNQQRALSENDIGGQCGELLSSCRQFSGTVIFVTNEVGMGIVPENALARRFRDLAGRCNQVIARDADAVVALWSGLPLVLKGNAALSAW